MQNILITGVSMGIGYSLCKEFINKGFRVFGSVRKKDDADRLSADFGANFYPLIFDVTDHQAVEESVVEVKHAIGDEGLHGLINNAGIAVGGPVMYLHIKKYQQQFDVNFFGQIAVTKAFLPLLGAEKNFHGKPGKIINMSSVSGQIAYPFMSPYCASKFALEAFSDSLRRELLLYGIDVITIEPGPIKTPIWQKSTTMRDEVLNSEFGPSLSKFVYQLGNIAQKGMDVDDLAYRVYRVFVKRKPKTRYVFTNKKLLSFVIPKYFISARRFDAVIRKMYF